MLVGAWVARSGGALRRELVRLGAESLGGRDERRGGGVGLVGGSECGGDLLGYGALHLGGVCGLGGGPAVTCCSGTSTASSRNPCRGADPSAQSDGLVDCPGSGQRAVPRP